MSPPPVAALAAFLAVVAAQRIGELLLSKRNAQRVRARGAREFGAAHFPFIVFVHVLFFVCLATEVLFLGARPGSLWPLWLLLWLGAQALRYAAIRALGERWNVRILVVPGLPPVRSGPYRFLRHPNYVAVAVELIAGSLLFGGWRTAIVISLLNAIALRIRIRAEDAALTPPRPLVLVAILLAISSLTYAQGVRRCADCGQVILDEYLEVEGRTFHPEHVRCAYCLERIDDLYVPMDGKFYHRGCYQTRFVVNCIVCGKLITEEYREDFWGNPAHAHHSGETPSCDFCNRFIVGGFAANSVEFKDGRRLCGVCAPASVTTVDEVRALMPGVAAALQAHSVRVATDGIPLLLLDAHAMRKASPDRKHLLSGFTDFVETPIEEGSVKSFNIVLLYGMPELELTATLAHELMHVWLLRNNVPLDDIAWVEGSCTYAAYLVMQGIETREAAFVMHQFETATDSIYGDGFRRVKQYADENGIDAWLSATTVESR